MSHEKFTHCPKCGSQWIGEERVLQECFDCGYPDQNIQKQQTAPIEWDTDDDEAMPNTIL